MATCTYEVEIQIIKSINKQTKCAIKINNKVIR